MRKKDEMEQRIANKSIKITWGTTIITLFVIGFIQQYDTGGGNIFLTIAISSVMLNILLERYYLSKVNEDRSFIKFIVLMIIMIAILLLIVWWSTS